MKLAAGSATQTVLPFTGLNAPTVWRWTAAGNVYVADHGNNRVLKLAAGSTTRPCCRSPASTAPRVWRWTPPATSTSPTGATIGC